MPKTPKRPGRSVTAHYWSTLPGFLLWFRKEAPKHSNREMIPLVEKRFKVKGLTRAMMVNLRAIHRIPMGEAAKLRASADRSTHSGTFWSNLPGFLDWLKANGSNYTNKELAAEIEKRFNRALRPEVAGALRRRYQIQMSAETKRRAFDQRHGFGRAPDAAAQTPQEKMDRDMLAKHVRALSARQTLYEIIGERVLSATAQLAKLPPVQPLRLAFPKDQSKEEMVLVISDVQAGMVVNAKEMGGLGNFNSNVLIQEIEALQQAVLRIRRYHPNVRKIHVPFVGDIVEGNTIFQGQLRQVDANVVEQVMFCVEHFARMLHFLCHLFDEVECYGVIGNHGRIGLKGELSPMANFDYLIYKWLAERLAGVKQVKWTIPDTWWQIMDVLGWRFLLVHGDNAGSSYGSIPYYGVTRHATKYQNLFRTLKRVVFSEEVGNIGVPQEIGDGFDVMICGHFSTAAVLNTPGGLVIMNGSFPGGTELSLKAMQLGDVPSQTLFAVHQKWGVTWHRHINLKALVGR